LRATGRYVSVIYSVVVVVVVAPGITIVVVVPGGREVQAERRCIAPDRGTTRSNDGTPFALDEPRSPPCGDGVPTAA